MEIANKEFDNEKYKEYKREVQEKWFKDNDYQGILVGPGIVPLRPDLGYYIKVDVLEIPESMFPEEFKQITQAYHDVLEKLKNHYIERNRKTKDQTSNIK